MLLSRKCWCKVRCTFQSNKNKPLKFHTKNTMTSEVTQNFNFNVGHGQKKTHFFLLFIFIFLLTVTLSTKCICFVCDDIWWKPVFRISAATKEICCSILTVFCTLHILVFIFTLVCLDNLLQLQHWEIIPKFI